MIHYLIGFMASGKTTCGRQWAKENAADFYDLDEWIEKAESATIGALFETQGETGFRIIEQQQLRILTEWVVESKSPAVIACGGGTPCFFDNMLFMKQNGKVIFLHTPFHVILQRLQQDKTRPLLAIHPNLEKLYESRLPIYLDADEIWTE